MPQITPETQNIGPVSDELISPRLTGANHTHVIRKTSYKDDPKYKARVARYIRRKTGRRANYVARAFGGEAYILRAFMVFHQVLQVTRQGRNKGLNFRNALFMIIAKQWLTSTGKDSFSPTAVGYYSNAILFTGYSIRTPHVHSLQLERLGFLNPLPIGKSGRIKYVLSMKARAFFRDLDTEFKQPFDVMSLLHKDLM